MANPTRTELNGSLSSDLHTIVPHANANRPLQDPRLIPCPALGAWADRPRVGGVGALAAVLVTGKIEQRLADQDPTLSPEQAAGWGVEPVAGILVGPDETSSAKEARER